MYQKYDGCNKELGFSLLPKTKKTKKHTKKTIVTLFLLQGKLLQPKNKLQQRKQGLNEANKYLLQQALEMANNLKIEKHSRDGDQALETATSK
jgi:hypothetical protein